MKYSKLKAYKISKINFYNKVSGTVHLNFQSKVSHHVRYSKNNICEAITCVDVYDANNKNSIAMTVEVSGIFEIIANATKEEIHLETGKELFIHAKAFVLAITGVAGIKPIILNDIDFDNQEILKYNLNDIKNQLGVNKPGPDNDINNGMDDTQDGPDGTE